MKLREYERMPRLLPVRCANCASELSPADAFASFGDDETGEQLWYCSEDCALEDGTRRGEINESRP